MTETGSSVKVKGAMKQGGGFAAYRSLFYGDTSLGHVMWAELVTALFGGCPGAGGLFLRRMFYPGLFGQAGRGVLFGRDLTLRHPKKIRLGNGVIIDEGCMIDAKGTTNRGITIEDGVFIGRHSIVYCKNGDIHLKRGVNISSHCTIFSSNSLTIEEGTVIGAYSYLLSGGEYDPADRETPFADQDGMETKGPLSVGANAWLGARVTVLDAASIGTHCVIGAGAVVTKPVPADSLAVGVPARVAKSL
jgi:acetyltransferase-like isoleucine patch superfamily enzyme